jgi:hypothetical protein
LLLLGLVALEQAFVALAADKESYPKTVSSLVNSARLATRMSKGAEP